MTTTVRITSKRQITIPAKIYNDLELKTGQDLLVKTENGSIVLTDAEKLVKELAGSIEIPKHLKGKDVDEAIEIAKGEYFREKWKKHLSTQTTS